MKMLIFKKRKSKVTGKKSEDICWCGQQVDVNRIGRVGVNTQEEGGEEETCNCTVGKKWEV